MSNLVHPLPISEAEVGVTMCVGVIPVDVNERMHAGYYVKGDQQSNYLPLLCAYISHQCQSGPQKTISTVTTALILDP